MLDARAGNAPIYLPAYLLACPPVCLSTHACIYHATCSMQPVMREIKQRRRRGVKSSPPLICKTKLPTRTSLHVHICNPKSKVVNVAIADYSKQFLCYLLCGRVPIYSHAARPINRGRGGEGVNDDDAVVRYTTLYMVVWSNGSSRRSSGSCPGYARPSSSPPDMSYHRHM